MLFDHPEVLFADEGLEYGGGDVGMVVGAQGVADIMEQSTDHVFLVFAASVGEGGGLQGVGQAVHRKTAVIASEQFQVAEDAVGQGGGKVGEMAGNRGPILGCAIVHVGEAGALTHQVLLWVQRFSPSVSAWSRGPNHRQCQLAILGGHNGLTGKIRYALN
ncbi:hypothetical protein D3C76_857800 [compost metagenome]